jgi:hypothetical protein
MCMARGDLSWKESSIASLFTLRHRAHPGAFMDSDAALFFYPTLAAGALRPALNQISALGALAVAASGSLLERLRLNRTYMAGIT